VDYAREQWTRALWFAEGVTNTYGTCTLVRTGLWSHEQFYEDLAADIAELESRPARQWKSVEEASLDAWLEKYPVYRRPGLSVSYYTKGRLLGVLLDIEIRDSTDNCASLDDVLHALNEQFVKRGRFYRDSADIRAVAEEVSGRNLGEFFARYVSGTDELPYTEHLARTGLVLKVQTRARAALGFLAGPAPDAESVVVEVDPASPAAQAGLREGDVLLELEHRSFPRNPEHWLRDRRPGDSVHLRLRRGGQERELTFTLAQRDDTFYQVEEAPNPTDKERRIRDGILKGTTNSPPQ